MQYLLQAGVASYVAQQHKTYMHMVKIYQNSERMAYQRPFTHHLAVQMAAMIAASDVKPKQDTPTSQSLPDMTFEEQGWEDAYYNPPTP